MKVKSTLKSVQNICNFEKLNIVLQNLTSVSIICFFSTSCLAVYLSNSNIHTSRSLAVNLTNLCKKTLQEIELIKYMKSTFRQNASNYVF